MQVIFPLSTLKLTSKTDSFSALNLSSKLTYFRNKP